MALFGSLTWPAGLILAVLAAPALADPYQGRGYTLGCDDQGCSLVSGGVFMVTTPDSYPDAIAVLLGLEPLTAVDLVGDIVGKGDITADLYLADVAVAADDLYADTLRYIQGEWRPQGEETPFSIRIDGLMWTEITAEGEGPSFLMSPGETCADGVAPGGIALSLVMIGGDPGEAACWQVEYAIDTTLDLRDFKGDQGLVSFVRVN